MSTGKSSSRKPAARGRGRQAGVRVGTLALSQEDAYEARWFTDRDLVRAIEMVREEAEAFEPDLLLLSGARFWSEEDEGGRMPTQSAQALSAVAGCPVLLEWPGDDEGPSRWLQVADGEVTVVRNDQFVVGSGGVAGFGHLVMAELGAGFGCVEVGGVCFVLLIGGEARVLQRWRGQVAEVLRRDWVLLHPSHRPCEGGNARASWDLVGAVEGRPPVLQLLTGGQGGARGWAPRAAVHVGPFRQHGDIDREVSNVAFAQGRPVVPLQKPLEIPGLVALRYAEFSVSALRARVS